METLLIILISALGGVAGWVYGGNLLSWIEKWFGKDWKDRVNAVDKVTYYFVYGVTFGLLMPVVSLSAMVALGASQWARRAVSWGPYIGCLIHGKIDLTKAGVQWINSLVFRGTGHIKVRACAALSIIGYLGGLIMTLGLATAYFLVGSVPPEALSLLAPALLLKGPIYWAFIELSGKITPLIPNDTRPMETQIEDQRNDGWGYSETAYSVYMFLVVALIVI